MSATAAALPGDPYAERVDHGRLRFLHGLNPLAKVAGPLPAMAWLIFARDIPVPLAFLVLGLALILVGTRLSGRMLALLCLGIPAFVAVMSVSFGAWSDPARVDRSVALVSIGDYTFYLGSLLVGLATALRLASVLALALLSGVSTTGADLARSFVQQLRVPYRIGYTALAAFRFVPRFGHELQVIRSAHRVRGMTGGRGPVAGIRRYLGYVIPLLAGAIRHAERVALAMDSRAFGAYRTRTERHLVPFRARDWLFILVFWAVSAALVLFVPYLFRLDST